MATDNAIALENRFAAQNYNPLPVVLYRGALSQLVHRRGVRLLSSHTESEVLALAPPESAAYLRILVDAWRACAYARRPPGADAVEALARGYRSL